MTAPTCAPFQGRCARYHDACAPGAGVCKLAPLTPADLGNRLELPGSVWTRPELGPVSTDAPPATCRVRS